MKYLAIVLVCCMLSGCSVGMALHGKPEVQTSALKIGQPRSEALMVIGQEPYRTMVTSESRIDVFECQRGNAPSAGRAIGHAAMDVLTWGFWEIIGTPVEALSTSKFYLTIKYNRDDEIIDIATSQNKGGLN